MLTVFWYFTDRCFNYVGMRYIGPSFTSSALYKKKAFYCILTPNGTSPALFLFLSCVTLNLSIIYGEVLYVCNAAWLYWLFIACFSMPE